MVERDLSGSVLDDRYRLISLVGAGGMGQVYEGKHLLLGRRVAVKVLPEQLSEDARFRARFAREARAASKIGHLNVVQVLDFGESPEGPAYIVMEFLEGRDLRDLLRKSGRLSWPRARHILLQAVSALKAAHAHDIVHRDIKPGNCFVVDLPHEGLTDVVKLLDFGIAKVLTDFESDGVALVKPLTGTGEIMGTASYMAPEQARGKPLDARSDIYSLGIMAYEMLTGRVPFAGANPLDVISRHIHAQPPPLRRAVPDILPECEALVLRTLAKNPRDRFASMAELETALLGIPGPSRATIRSRVFASSGAQSEAVAPRNVGDAKGTSGPQADDRSRRTAEEMATEAEHQGVTPRFGPLQRARDAQHAERKGLRVAVGGSDESIASKAAARRIPASERSSATSRPSQAMTKVRPRTAPPVEDAVDPAAATMVDPALRQQAAAAEKRERAKSPRRKRPQTSNDPITYRRSRGATISRVLGVVLLLGSGVAIASMTMPKQKDGRATVPSSKQDVLGETTVASIRAVNSTASGPPAEAKSAEETPGTITDPHGSKVATASLLLESASSKIEECKEVRKKAQRAEDGGEYPTLYRLTNRKSCWGFSYQEDYTALRVEALLETNRYEECVKVGERSRDVEVLHFVKLCRDEIRMK